ncbi:MAG: hypothetical protein H0W82_00025 [Actinobacteria bacterium]|nr:hypothetical protein [Actinomycetota bacterium]
MADSREAKHQGLRLNLGGAPAEAHHVVGLHGWFWPDEVTPVGGEGEITLEQAKKAAKDKGTPVELVDMTEAEADKRRKEIEQFRAFARRALRTTTPYSADEADRKQAEQASAAGKES